ncbi:MAG: biotin/lipoyl-binding protein, partial [Steroidobacteraceae bacterium]
MRVGLIVAGGVLLAAALLYGIHWFLHWRYIVSTDDAYLRADLVTVAPRVSGYIDEIYVSDNQAVAAGQPLLRIDVRNYKDTLSQQMATVDARQADLAAAGNQVLQQRAAIAQDRAQLTGAQANAQFARSQAERYRALRDQGVETDERYAQADNERQQTAASELSAAAALRVAERQLATRQSQVEQARAQLESAQASVSRAVPGHRLQRSHEHGGAAPAAERASLQDWLAVFAGALGALIATLDISIVNSAGEPGSRDRPGLRAASGRAAAPRAVSTQYRHRTAAGRSDAAAPARRHRQRTGCGAPDEPARHHPRHARSASRRDRATTGSIGGADRARAGRARRGAGRG